MIPRDPHEPPGWGTDVTAEPARAMSPEEYLAFERQAWTKHEYHDGHVYALSGASMRHNRIVVNLVLSIGNQLRGGPCEVFASDMRMHATAGLYAYPDVTIVCGKPELEDEHLDTLLNPTVLIEVLSPSTERYDRGRKAGYYRTLESLREYLFVSQDQPRIERYARTGEVTWVLTEAVGRDARITLDSVGCTLELSEVYEGVG